MLYMIWDHLAWILFPLFLICVCVLCVWERGGRKNVIGSLILLHIWFESISGFCCCIVGLVQVCISSHIFSHTKNRGRLLIILFFFISVLYIIMKQVSSFYLHLNLEIFCHHEVCTICNISIKIMYTVWNINTPCFN